MHAGGRRTDTGYNREFGAGARVAVHQAIEHTGARRFANGGGDSGDGEIGMKIYMHTLMIDEVFLQDNRQTAWRGTEWQRAAA